MSTHFTHTTYHPPLGTRFTEVRPVVPGDVVRVLDSKWLPEGTLTVVGQVPACSRLRYGHVCVVRPDSPGSRTSVPASCLEVVGHLERLSRRRKAAVLRFRKHRPMDVSKAGWAGADVWLRRERARHCARR